MIQLNNIQLALWDLDGTLINSESIHYQAGINAFNQINLPIICTKIVAGMDNCKCFEVFTGLKLDNSSNLEIYHKWEHNVINEVLNLINANLAITQSIELVKFFHEHGIAQAIVSNSNRNIIEKAISCIGINQYISKIFSIEDVTNPKPHPEPYLNAMNNFAKESHQTIVFEDSITGITSARSANTRYVIGIGEETIKHNPHYTFALTEASWLDKFTK